MDLQKYYEQHADGEMYPFWREVFDDVRQTNIVPKGLSVGRTRAHQPMRRPFVILKARQVGATTLYGAIERDCLEHGSGIAHASFNHHVSADFMQRFFSDIRINNNTGLLNKNKIVFGSISNICSLRGYGLRSILFCDEFGYSGSTTTEKLNSLFSQGEVYASTPHDNPELKTLWNQSEKYYYHLHCSRCDDYFQLYAPGVNWEDVWLHDYTVKCGHCGYKQDKRQAAKYGTWLTYDKVHNNVGYHMNKLYLPMFSKEEILQMKQDYSHKQYTEEVLGEFVVAGSSCDVLAKGINKKIAQASTVTMGESGCVGCEHPEHARYVADYRKMGCYKCGKEGVF